MEQQEDPDMSMIYDLTEISGTFPPCPGVTGAQTKWYCVLDPETRQPIPNFDVCRSCVKSLEVILPPLKGFFVPGNLPADSFRTCDMRFESRRFRGYMDELETACIRAEEDDRAVDMRKFAKLAKRKASLRECEGDKQLQGEPWHFIPELPEFTVCEECYDEVVLPSIMKGSEVASRFNRSLRFVGRRDEAFSCQLYSPRMRSMFKKATTMDDFEMLGRETQVRREVERELKGEKAGLTKKYRSQLAAMANPEVTSRDALNQDVASRATSGVMTGRNDQNIRDVMNRLKEIDKEWKAWE
jgi:hypothetical protein